MTDGIIQKVFKKNSLEMKDVIESIRDSVDSDIYNELIDGHAQLQQELIQEIKKEFPINYDKNYSMWHKAIQRELIGDTQ